MRSHSHSAPRSNKTTSTWAHWTDDTDRWTDRMSQSSQPSHSLPTSSLVQRTQRAPRGSKKDPTVVSSGTLQYYTPEEQTILVEARDLFVVSTLPIGIAFIRRESAHAKVIARSAHDSLAAANATAFDQSICIYIMQRASLLCIHSSRNSGICGSRTRTKEDREPFFNTLH